MINFIDGSSYGTRRRTYTQGQDLQGQLRQDASPRLEEAWDGGCTGQEPGAQRVLSFSMSGTR